MILKNKLCENKFDGMRYSEQVIILAPINRIVSFFTHS